MSAHIFRAASREKQGKERIKMIDFIVYNVIQFMYSRICIYFINTAHTNAKAFLYICITYTQTNIIYFTHLHTSNDLDFYLYISTV